MPGEVLVLPPYEGMGPVILPHSYWAGGPTAEMVYAANGKHPCSYFVPYYDVLAGAQIEELIYLLGLTDHATGFVGVHQRKAFLKLELGIGPGPR
jgi:hypothetical protein